MGRWNGPGRPLMEGFSLAARPRQWLKAIKRLEAEERNAKTPEVYRKAYRRALVDENGTVPTAVPAKSQKKRGKKTAA